MRVDTLHRHSVFTSLCVYVFMFHRLGIPPVLHMSIVCIANSLIESVIGTPLENLEPTHHNTSTLCAVWVLLKIADHSAERRVLRTSQAPPPVWCRRKYTCTHYFFPLLLVPPSPTHFVFLIFNSNRWALNAPVAE